MPLQGLSLLKTSYFQTTRWIWFVFGMMIDTGPKFNSATPPPLCPFGQALMTAFVSIVWCLLDATCALFQRTTCMGC